VKKALIVQVVSAVEPQYLAVVHNWNKNNNKTKKNHIGKSHNRCHKYFWTHGSCDHSSKECNCKTDGHKDDASFSNMLGG